MGVHSLANLPSNSTIKKKAAIIIMAVEVKKVKYNTNLLNIENCQNNIHLIFHLLQKQTLMQHVLRCDYEACRQYLVNLEQAFLLDQGNQALGALLGHRCDGNRNILHAAVSVCFPVSNKETKEEEGELLYLSITGQPHCYVYPSQMSFDPTKTLLYICKMLL